MFLFIVLTTIFAYTTFLLVRKRRSPKLPPGPTGLPLVGSLPFLDPQVHKYLANLSKKYGPILSLRLGSKFAVVISSPSLASSVLREHDNIFANHDITIAAAISAYDCNNVPCSPNGPKWRMLRRVLVHEVLSPSSLDAVYNLRQEENRSTVCRIHAKSGTPVNLREELFLAVSNVIINTIWGGTLDGDKDRESVCKDFQVLVDEMNEMLFQFNISDFFPALARFDLQGVKKKMEALRGAFEDIFNRVIEKRSSCGERPKDFLETLLRMERTGGDSKTPFTMTHVKALLIDIIQGGTDTTSSTLEWTMAEVLNKPDILHKIQTELDQVVGKDRLVEESDLPQLQFLSLVIKEALRLHPPQPVIPHHSSSPCFIDDYFIPEGAAVIVNVWAIQRDPSLWTDPLEFKPERFLQEDCKRDFTGKNFDYFPFSSGRRMCAGMAMAEKMTGYILAAFLHSFDWKLVDDMEVDFSEKFGIVMKRVVPLIAIPTPRLSKDDLYM
jgi:cytochrome P450